MLRIVHITTVRIICIILKVSSLVFIAYVRIGLATVLYILFLFPRYLFLQTISCRHPEMADAFIVYCLTASSRSSSLIIYLLGYLDHLTYSASFHLVLSCLIINRYCFIGVADNVKVSVAHLLFCCFERIALSNCSAYLVVSC